MPYNSTIRAAIATLILGYLTAEDGNSPATPCTLEIGTAAWGSVLVAFELDEPAATLAGSTLTFQGMPIAALGLASGTAAVARIKDGNGTVLRDGLTVGVSATNVIVDNTSIALNQPCELQSLTIAQPT